jgi:Uma2 family endonuclease
MANGIQQLLPESVHAPLPRLPDGMPLFYEDEDVDEVEMGDNNLHSLSIVIFQFGVQAHLAPRPAYQVYMNLNLYYRDGPVHRRSGSPPNVSPDVMVVRPYRRLPVDLSSYMIGEHGPAPVLTTEVLSQRSYQQRDRREKEDIYARLGVREYVQVDVTGRFLAERLLLKRLRRDGTWIDEQDADGGVTSRLGFRVILEPDGQLRVLDARTGAHYLRPSEAQAAEEARRQEQAARIEAEEARRQAEETIRALQAELDRLRGSAAEDQPARRTSRRRRQP